MILAPFWPHIDPETRLNWPKWLRLKTVRVTDIDQEGAHYRVTFSDGSYDSMTVTRAFAEQALTRADCDKRWYQDALGHTKCHFRGREQRIKRGGQKGGYLNQTLIHVFGDMGAPPGLIFDIDRFHAHGPKHFEMNSFGQLWIKKETISGWVDIDSLG